MARRDIEADLKKRKAGWLLKAAREMVKMVLEDWRQWRRGSR